MRLKDAAPLALSALMLTACGAESKTPAIYQGPIEPLQGQRLMSDSRFFQQTDAMRHSGDELLAKVGNDITILHTSKTFPSELTGLINEKTFPIAITEDPQSDVSLSIVHGSQTSETFNMVSDGITTQINFTSPLEMGIEISTKNDVGTAQPLVEAVFLAKEHLSEMLMLRIAQEFEETGIAEVSDSSGNPITDPMQRIRAYEAILAETNPATPRLDKVIDVFPIMMVSLIIRDQYNKGAFTTTHGLGHFGIASDFLMGKPETEQKVRQIMHDWATSGNLTGPSGITSEIFEADMLREIYRLNDFLYSTQAPFN